MSPQRESAASMSRLSLAMVCLGFLPLLLVVDTSIALLRGWRPESRVEMGFIAAFSTTAVLLVLLIVTRRGRAFLSRRQVAFPLMALVLTILGIFTISELTLRLWVEPARAVQFHKRERNMVWRFTPSPQVMAGVSPEARFTTNAEGIRGQQWPARDRAYRILCVGGSTTECVYLDDARTWPALLMAALNSKHGSEGPKPVWVGNIGISGYDAKDHLKFVERSDLLRQIDCAVFLCGINDLQHALRDPELMTKLAPRWERSMNWRFVLDGYLALRRKYGFVESMFEDRQGLDYELRRKTRAVAPVCGQLPDLTDAVSNYADIIKAIILKCRAVGVRPVFVCQPTMWREGLSKQALASMWLGMTADGSFLSVERLREGIDRFNHALRDTCRAYGVECVDTSSMDGREDLYYDDVHLNEAGARVMADLVAKHFLSESAQKARD